MDFDDGGDEISGEISDPIFKRGTPAMLDELDCKRVKLLEEDHQQSTSPHNGTTINNNNNINGSLEKSKDENYFARLKDVFNSPVGDTNELFSRIANNNNIDGNLEKSEDENFFARLKDVFNSPVGADTADELFSGIGNMRERRRDFMFHYPLLTSFNRPSPPIGFIGEMRELGFTRASPDLNSPQDAPSTLSHFTFRNSETAEYTDDGTTGVFTPLKDADFADSNSQPASPLQDISSGLQSAKFISNMFMFSSSLTTTESSFSAEQMLRRQYEPWLTEELKSVPLDAEFEGLREFNLVPFRTTEYLPSHEDTLADREYWPKEAKPLRDYGEFSDELDWHNITTHNDRMKVFNQTYRDKLDLSERRRLEKVAKNVWRGTEAESTTGTTAGSTKTASTTTSSISQKAYAPHYKSLGIYCNYCRVYNSDRENPPAYFAIEEEWIPLIIEQKCIAFDEYLQIVRRDPNIGVYWELKRVRRFLDALIPCIFYNAHMEEVAIDFLDDFVAPFVVPAELERLANVNSKPTEFSEEFVKLGVTIIKHLASPTLLEKLFKVIPGELVTTTGAGELYEALHDKMLSFRVPEEYAMPEREKPAADASKEVKEAYQALLRCDKYQKLYEDSKRAACMVQRTRSFVHLQLLVKYLPAPILDLKSKWTADSLLEVPRELEQPESTIEKSTSAGSKSNKSKKSSSSASSSTTPAATTTASSDSSSSTERISVHHNQDLFDAMFFSPFFHVFLNAGSPNIKHLVEQTLESFVINRLSKFASAVPKSNFLFRLLYSIDIFIRLTRFNCVANVPPPIIQYRRYLIAYVVHNVLVRFGQAPETLISCCFCLHCHSLYEALCVYQIIPIINESKCLYQLTKYLKSINSIDCQAFLILITYNPMKWQNLEKVFNNSYDHFNPDQLDAKQLEKRELAEKAQITIAMLREVIALVKDVGLAPIYERHVFQHMCKTSEQMVMPTTEEPQLAIHSQFVLPIIDYASKYQDSVVYNWSLPRAYKDLLSSHSATDVALYHPYNIFAAQILLARRFGISFDASTVMGNLGENFSWPNVIDIANFTLDREAQNIVNNATDSYLDQRVFKMHKVVDPHMYIYKQWALSRDENTHFINQLIRMAFAALGLDKEQLILETVAYDRLFDMYEEALEFIEISKTISTFRNAQALELLKDVLSDFPEFNELLGRL